MNCPNCNTWNPDDKEVCWRCQTELPRPQPKKQKKQTVWGFPIWMWIALVLFFVMTFFGQCLFAPLMGS